MTSTKKKKKRKKPIIYIMAKPLDPGERGGQYHKNILNLIARSFLLICHSYPNVVGVGLNV